MVSLWLGLNLMDLATTLTALEMGYSEGNPIMSGMGSIEFVVYKIGLTLLALVLLTRFQKTHLLKPLCLGIGIVVIWNLALVIGGLTN